MTHGRADKEPNSIACLYSKEAGNAVLERAASDRRIGHYNGSLGNDSVSTAGHTGAAVGRPRQGSGVAGLLVGGNGGFLRLRGMS